MKKIDKISAFLQAWQIYLELCKKVNNLNEEEKFFIQSSISEGVMLSAVFDKYPTARKHIKNEDIEYLIYLGKYLMKISMIDRSNLEASISLEKNTLHLALSER